jgi:hypothetical protein
MAPKFFTQGNKAINMDHIIAFEIIDNKIRFYVTDKVKALMYRSSNFDVSNVTGDSFITFTYESKEQAESALKAVLES